jgi:hypothetical protein
MHHSNEIPKPITGRTYSLYANEQSSSNFYEQIQDITDSCLQLYPDKSELLKILQKASRSSSFLNKTANSKKNPRLYALLKNLKSYLGSYITSIDDYLARLSLSKLFDGVLSTKEHQYYLYMIEFELINRICKDDFLKSKRKIALLPHCLRDLSRKCMSAPTGMDYVCKSCSKNCYINFASNILKESNFEPYIWMTASQRALFKKQTDGRKDIGVLGIACIPELIRGMRMCLKKNIPVVGIPLDANRCARWMGEFHPNTINLEKLKELIS